MERILETDYLVDINLLESLPENVLIGDEKYPGILTMISYPDFNSFSQKSK